eukprot:TRINITY_DN37094_c0_g1_i1.p1 TRINITY_DN37094_c0_g1~~TRINITY_DN37094_c0_g1_i1.p1  ORF type:complete len:643 (-),score=87.34 TRINITY_DN37094_c0_g1_i1:111-2039(-)
MSVADVVAGLKRSSDLDEVSSPSSGRPQVLSPSPLPGSRFRQYRRCGSPALATRKSRLAQEGRRLCQEANANYVPVQEERDAAWADQEEGDRWAEAVQPSWPLSEESPQRGAYSLMDSTGTQGDDVRQWSYREGGSHSSHGPPESAQDAADVGHRALSGHPRRPSAPSMVRAQRAAAGRAIALLQAANRHGSSAHGTSINAGGTSSAAIMTVAQTSKETGASCHPNSSRSTKTSSQFSSTDPLPQTAVSQGGGPPHIQSNAFAGQQLQCPASEESMQIEQMPVPPSSVKRSSDFRRGMRLSVLVPGTSEVPAVSPPITPSSSSCSLHSPSTSSRQVSIPNVHSSGDVPEQTQASRGQRRSRPPSLGHALGADAPPLSIPATSCDDADGGPSSSTGDGRGLSRQCPQHATADPFWKHAPSMGIRALSSIAQKDAEGAAPARQVITLPSPPPSRTATKKAPRDKTASDGASQQQQTAKPRRSNSKSAPASAIAQVPASTSKSRPPSSPIPSAAAPSKQVVEAAPEVTPEAVPVEAAPGEAEESEGKTSQSRFIDVKRQGRSSSPPLHEGRQTWRVAGHVSPECVIPRNRRRGNKEKLLALPFPLCEEDPRLTHLIDTLESAPIEFFQESSLCAPSVLRRVGVYN